MIIKVKELAGKGWLYFRVPILFVFAIVAAFFAAYLASNFTQRIYEYIVAAYHSLDSVFGKPSGIANTALDRGKLFAGIAIGAAVVVAWFKDTIEKVSHLWPWPTATSDAIREAVVAIFISGIGLFISAFAVESATRSTQEFALAFDGISLPPIGVNSDGALATFYIPFYEDAGYGALASDRDISIRVPDEFVPFLEDLGKVLQKCATPNSPVKVSLAGFASTTKWYAIETDTAQGQLDHIRAVLLARYENEGKGTQASPDVEASLRQFEQSRAEIATIADKEQHSSTRSETPWPDAFNLWLAKKRRDAVYAVLKIAVGSSISVDPLEFGTYNEMQTALAINDVATISRGTKGGLLSRSVFVRIDQAGSCVNSTNKSRADLTKSNLEQ